MAEFSDYIESRTPIADEDVTGNEIFGVSKNGSARSMTGQQIANLAEGGASAAEDVSFTPAGNIVATNVQAAIEELDSEKEPTLSAASESAQGKIELATQAETNTGTDDVRAVTPKKFAEVDHTSSALTDGASIAITGPKHTLTTDEATVTWSYTFTGEEMKILVTLNATSADWTFPSGTLCVADGDATGNNTCPLIGESGDKYLLVVTKFGSEYVAVVKNIKQ